MSTKPIHTIKRGSIEAAIWENRSKNGSFFRATLTRGYRTTEGAWKSTASFGQKELGDVALVAIQVQAWMHDEAASLEEDTQAVLANAEEEPETL